MEAGHELSPTDLLNSGQAALARGAWQEARVAFEQALVQQELPEALEGLGSAAARLDDVPTMFDARERAYRLYLLRDDRSGAARMAVALAMDCFVFRGEMPVANGWLQRAHRLLHGQESSREFGWLMICQAHMAIYRFDVSTTLRLATQAATLGRALQDVNLEMLALAYKGLALVMQGAIDEGMRYLDEVTTAVVADEMTDVDAACTACCCLIYACEQVRDYARAAQWCKRLEELAKQGSHRTMFAVCRTYYANLLIGQGEWDQAEAELTEAVQAIETTCTAQAAEGLVRLGALYARQGRFSEAMALFKQAELPPFRALAGQLYLLGRAAMALEQNDPQTAINLAERFLRVTPVAAQITRAPALELLIHAWISLGERAQAEAILAEFRAVVDTVTTKPMQGSICFAQGLVAAAGEDHERARQCFEDAAELWAQSGAPVETAHARLELAGVLVELGRVDAAQEEATAALASFCERGAHVAARRAAEFLHQLKYRSRADEQDTLPRLTQRQLEVLRLVAQGLSNKEIAARLDLSEHTVHRHVANILNQLTLSSRAAAAAYAAQNNLL